MSESFMWLWFQSALTPQHRMFLRSAVDLCEATTFALSCYLSLVQFHDLCPSVVSVLLGLLQSPSLHSQRCMDFSRGCLLWNDSWNDWISKPFAPRAIRLFKGLLISIVMQIYSPLFFHDSVLFAVVSHPRCVCALSRWMAVSPFCRLLLLQ